MQVTTVSKVRRGALVAVILALAWAGAALAAGSPAPPSAPRPDLGNFDLDRQLLARLQNQLPSTTDDARLAFMARQAAAIQAAADSRVAAADAQISTVDAVLRHRPFDRPRKLTAADTRKKAALLAQKAALGGQLAQAQPVATLASQTYSRIAERRRESFSDRVTEQTSSPLSPDFWSSIASSAGADLKRFWAMIDLSLDAAWAAPEPRGLAGLGFAGLAIFLCFVPLRLLLCRLGWRLCRRFAFGQAARTLAILWTFLADVGAVALGAGLARLCLQWGGVMAPSASFLSRALVGAVIWAAAILALGRALATDADPSHRLLKVDDGEALRGRFALFVVALVTGAGLFLQRLNYVVGASVAATIAANCVISLAYASAIVLLLVSFGSRGEEKDQPLPPRRAPARTVLALLLAAAAVATVGAVLLGYTTLAALISGQAFWLGLVAGATYLLLRLIDDLCRLIAHEQSRPARTLSAVLGLKVTTVVQIWLLVCAGLQLVVILAAVTLALTPFGRSGELLVGNIRALGGAIRIGKATLSPTTIAAGFVTFGFGVSLAHLARNWLERRYLPATDWDAGVRNSVSTGVAYLGVAIALVCALGVAGLGFQQIALVASALSVGIGFGLQQIVQNFVAGIILLIERPVKVGDWVNVSGVEGDVLDIRVRATEIRTADRSTVIVPNSSLITMNVQNKTLGDLQTRAGIQVALAKPADAARARDILRDVAAANPDVLDHPPPDVFIESLAAAVGGAVQLSLWVTLAEPRQAHRVKSELYFALLEAFEKAGVALP